jgi:hypothetical protein
MQCAISGSFRKFYSDIIEVMQIFVSKGIQVLSPPYSYVLNEGDEFVIFASDDCEDAGVLAGNHLEAIQESDFLYVYNPAGYVGVNTALEIGYAHAHSVPIVALAVTGNPGLDCFIDHVLMPEDVGLYFKNGFSSLIVELSSASNI